VKLIRFGGCPRSTTTYARFVYRLGHCPFTAGRRGSIPPPSTISCVVMEKSCVHQLNALSLLALSAGTQYELTETKAEQTVDEQSV
jgi:hypothetical protein